MKRELIVTVAGTDHTVIVEPIPGAEGRFRVTVDGVEHAVDAAAIRRGTWSLVLDGHSFTVDLDPRRTGIHASVGAGEVLLAVEDALHRRLAAAASGTRGDKPAGEMIRAPIAGKVVKVLVAVGDSVAAGTPVMVLEAMKMENELVAERGGTVKAVTKQAGQAVDTGDVLIEIE
jgi:biotin carboxyl carrier protein